MPDRAAGLTYRPFADGRDYTEGVELQRSTWGADFTECVPASILQISQKVGGITAGAFDGDGYLVGFVYGVSGLRHGRPAHWSHMLAVRPEYRSIGIGTKLKALQRDLLLTTNIEIAYWTYDPLIAGNAHFNLNLLAAYPAEYVPDMYGDNTGSDLHSGLGTDRFVVEWHMRHARVAEALAGRPTTVDADDAPLANADPSSDPHQLDETQFPTDPTIRVAIPSDIQRIKASAPDVALSWRRVTRHVLQWYLAKGYLVVGFRRDSAAERGFYILSTTEEKPATP